MKLNAKVTGQIIPFLIFIFVVFACNFSIAQPNPGFTSQANNVQVSTDSLLMGQALFFDTDLSIDSTSSCVSCHYNRVIDTLNWNPSVLDLARKWRTRSQFEFEDIFYLPLTKKLFESNKNFNLNGEQIFLLKYYLDYADLESLIIPERKFNINLFFIIVLLAVIFLALIDLVFSRLIKYKLIHLALILLSMGFGYRIIYSEMIQLGLQQGYEPDQPIKFSHKVHSGENGTDCYFCHMPAKYSSSAGIPGVNICLNCHAGVVEGQRSGGFEISKLLDYKQAKKVIQWVSVNNLPDHVSFNHSSHINEGIECAECHGLIEEMDRTRQDLELSMSWCLDCHQDRKINIEDKDYYSNYRKYLEQNNKAVDSATVYQLGGWDCMNCHY